MNSLIFPIAHIRHRAFYDELETRQRQQALAGFGAEVEPMTSESLPGTGILATVRARATLFVNARVSRR